jgi:hypothetical protein
VRELSDDWIDLLNCLLDADARFLVVGAHALAVHGVPRGTQDLDVWVDPDADNASRVWRALLEFGAPLSALGLNPPDLQETDVVVQIGVAPNRIDLLTSLSGISSFDAAWTERIQSRVGDIVVPVIGREALVANKRATARLKDLADIEALEKGTDRPTTSL